MAKDKKNISFFDKIRYKYRLIIINDDTFEQKTSIKLSKFNLYIGLGSFILLMVFIVTSIIAFTNIKYYLPGVGRLDIRNEIRNLYIKTDSLTIELDQRNLWIENFQKLLKGDVDSLYSTKKNDSSDAKINIDNIDLEFIPNEDKLLREEVENQMELEKLNHRIQTTDLSLNNDLFSNVELKMNLEAPLQGVVINSFSLKDDHLGIDIAGKTDEKIKAIYKGVVILSEWNPKTGYVIAIQHPGNMISFYKHNSILLKKRGTFVKKGEAIAVIGSSGELSSGPHLHFELWKNGTIQDPSKYIKIDKLK